MTGLRAAVERIHAAIERKEPILIYGDYDVDGTMAVIILKAAIELCGGSADFHVPHRIREGYDMRDDVIERAAAAGIRLIISVDMGIRAFAPAETAKRLGVDLIVTDHHLPGPDGVPHALAVVNPNQSGCQYPYKQLCGAGVAFKVSQGLMQHVWTLPFKTSYHVVYESRRDCDTPTPFTPKIGFVSLGLMHCARRIRV
jgi:single-stranded-DNA-specific exonuclease